MSALETLESRTLLCAVPTPVQYCDLDGDGRNETISTCGNIVTVVNVNWQSPRRYDIGNCPGVNFCNLDGRPGKNIWAIRNGVVVVINVNLNTTSTYNLPTSGRSTPPTWMASRATRCTPSATTRCRS